LSQLRLDQNIGGALLTGDSRFVPARGRWKWLRHNDFVDGDRGGDDGHAYSGRICGISMH
jgi:hypothetical protein